MYGRVTHTYVVYCTVLLWPDSVTYKKLLALPRHQDSRDRNICVANSLLRVRMYSLYVLLCTYVSKDIGATHFISRHLQRSRAASSPTLSNEPQLEDSRDWIPWLKVSPSG